MKVGFTANQYRRLSSIAREKNEKERIGHETKEKRTLIEDVLSDVVLELLVIW